MDWARGLVGRGALPLDPMPPCRRTAPAASAAQPKWAAATAYNRGQVLYRMAEMLEGKKFESVELLDNA
mgnify:CR=1 FL=1